MKEISIKDEKGTTVAVCSNHTCRGIYRKFPFILIYIVGSFSKVTIGKVCSSVVSHLAVLEVRICVHLESSRYRVQQRVPVLNGISNRYLVRFSTSFLKLSSGDDPAYVRRALSREPLLSNLRDQNTQTSSIQSLQETLQIFNNTEPQKMTSAFEPSLSTSTMRPPLSSADAPSMADSLPSINFGFEELRDRMAKFTVKFDNFIEQGRKRVLEERNQFRMNVAELQGKTSHFLCSHFY